jgi:hypothetical protein
MEVGALAFVVLGTGAGAPGIAMVLLANMVAGIVISPLGGVVADRMIAPRAMPHPRLEAIRPHAQTPPRCAFAQGGPRMP